MLLVYLISILISRFNRMSHIQPPLPFNPLSIEPCPSGRQMLPISRDEPMLRSKDKNQPAISHHTHHIQEPLTIKLAVTLVSLQEPLSTFWLNTLLIIVRPEAFGIHMPIILPKALVAQVTRYSKIVRPYFFRFFFNDNSSALITVPQKWFLSTFAYAFSITWILCLFKTIKSLQCCISVKGRLSAYNNTR